MARAPAPAVRRARAALAAAVFRDRPPEVLAQRRAELADAIHAARIDRAVQAVVDAAPELTAEQRDTLSCLLAPARDGDAA